MVIQYERNLPLSAEEIIAVFESVGWKKNEENIVEAFEKSYYVTAFDGDKLVGFARAISDGFYYTGIYDVVVRTAYQRQGIAKTLVRMLMDSFSGTYLFLTYTEGLGSFYEKCGFQNNDNAMWIPK